MTVGYVLDTHAAIWALFEPERLSRVAREVIGEALEARVPLFISTISLVEVCYLCEKRRLPEQLLDQLLTYLDDEGGLIALSIDREVVEALRRVPRAAVPDMPDRIVAATALARGIPVISADQKIRSSGVDVVW